MKALPTQHAKTKAKAKNKPSGLTASPLVPAMCCITVDTYTDNPEQFLGEKRNAEMVDPLLDCTGKLNSSRSLRGTSCTQKIHLQIKAEERKRQFKVAGIGMGSLRHTSKQKSCLWCVQMISQWHHSSTRVSSSQTPMCYMQHSSKGPQDSSTCQLSSSANSKHRGAELHPNRTHFATEIWSLSHKKSTP